MQAKSPEDVEKYMQMFQEVQQAVDSKQLHPMIRTQYMRTAFQIPFDATVRISLDTNLTMIKENPDNGPTCHEAGRRALPWCSCLQHQPAPSTTRHAWPHLHTVKMKGARAAAQL